MASGALESPETKTEEWIRRFFRPKILNTFRETSQKSDLEPIEIEYIREPGMEPEIITLEAIYPFHTILDIKTALYLAKNKSADFLPIYQAILVEKPEDGSLSHLEYDWIKTSQEGVEREIYLTNPFSFATKTNPNPEFTTSTGQAKPLKLNIFTRMTFENRIIDTYTKGLPRLKLYLFRDVYNLVKVGGMELSEMEWTRRIKPYYPQIQRTQLEPTSEDIDFFGKLGTVHDFDIDNLNKIESIIPSVDTLDYKIKSIRNMRFVYVEPESEISRDIATFFYETDVNSVFPFLRMLPSQGTPITKVYLQGELKNPEIADPKLLLQWAGQQKPERDQDYLFGKIVLNRSAPLPQKLYGTFEMFANKKADISILPPKIMKKFDIDRDLYELASSVGEFISKTPYANQTPTLGNTSLLCTFEQEIGSPVLTKSFIKSRLAPFSQFFQEISPLPGETAPIATLRYKAVSNFTSENKIFRFLSQLSLRQQTADEPAILELLTNEFRLTRFESKQYLENWLLSEKEVEETAPDSNDYIPIYNRGTDVSIYRASQNSYVVAIYGLQSVIDFHRIMTCMGIIFRMSDEQFDEIQPSRVKVQTAMEAEEDTEFMFMAEPEIEEEEEIPVASKGAAGLRTSIQEEMLRDEASGGLDFLEGMEAFMEDEEEPEKTSGAPATAAALVESIADDSRDIGEEKQVVAPIQRPEAISSEKGSLAKFFLKKLQETDLGLFSFKRYTSDCQASDTRQPAVMNKEQYQYMQSVYLAGNPPVYFRLYPLKGTEEPFPPGSEVYTVLRYGSNPAKSNYYVCCRYFCIRDYMIVTENDFVSDKDRFGNTKQKNTCPFCGGKKIENLKEVEEGQTVFERKLTPSKKRHTHIGFLKIVKHPDGYPLPCCFSEDEPIYFSSHTAYEKEREILSKSAIPASVSVGFPAVDYAITLSRFYRKYILGPEKFPLDVKDEKGPQIGLLQSGLDNYFQQDPKDIATRSQIRMELKGDAEGFLRLAAENRLRYRAESFLSALAPYLRKNSAENVKEEILKVVTPKIFITLNYGNLVLEFYQPNDPTPTNEELDKWSKLELGISLNEEKNKYQLLRIYKSFFKFQAFMNDKKEQKEYRQFAQLLSTGKISPAQSKGLVLIILDIDEEGNVSVRCPPFGYNLETYDRCDIAFISHHPENIWEPLFYFRNVPQGKANPGNYYQIDFQKSERAKWPDIVKKRVDEFVSNCGDSGRTVFSSQMRIDSFAMLGLGQLYQKMGEANAHGIVRDAYNHVVGITYKASKRKPVVVPVVDDGFLIIEKKIHLGWDDFEPGTAEDVLFIYKQILNVFPNYPGYEPFKISFNKEKNGYDAIQLKNGLYIPIKNTTSAEAETIPLEKDTEETQREDFEWKKDMEIYFGKPDEKQEVLEKIKEFQEGTEKELLEIYAHLRVTFANWFAIKATPELRRTMEAILSDTDIPTFERRKRLEILVGSEILSWMDDAPRETGEKQTLLRVDCRIKGEGDCKDRCVWKSDEGTCKLHTPATFKDGSRVLNVKRLFLYRLLDELLRYPEKEQELITNTVSKLSDMTRPILIGRQYILPENDMAWYDLLRLKWVKTFEESPEFFEEFSRPPPSVPVQIVETNLPDSLLLFLGENDPRLKNLFLYTETVPVSESPFLPYIGNLGVDLKQFLIDRKFPPNPSILNQDLLNNLAQRLDRILIQINLQPAPTAAAASGALEAEILMGFPPEKGTDKIVVYIVSSGTVSVLSKKKEQIVYPFFGDLPQKLQDMIDDYREKAVSYLPPVPPHPTKPRENVTRRRRILLPKKGGNSMTRRQHRR
jgi:hypothetical protein